MKLCYKCKECRQLQAKGGADLNMQISRTPIEWESGLLKSAAPPERRGTEVNVLLFKGKADLPYRFVFFRDREEAETASTLFIVWGPGPLF